MKCKEFKSRFINNEHLQLDEVAFSHIKTCTACRRLYESTTKAFEQFEQAACPSVNPYFTEKVMGKLAPNKWKQHSQGVRLALIASVIVTFLIGGLTVYIADSKTQQHQYDLLSLNDITKTPIAFEK